MIKRALFVLVLALGLTAINMQAASPKAPTTVLFEKLVALIPTCEHWEENNLAEIGLTELFKEIREADEDNDKDEGLWYFVYGVNAKVISHDYYNAVLENTGSHAFAIEVFLANDNRTVLYFKEKADYDEFLSIVRKSREYSSRSDGYQEIGSCSINCEGLTDGWYVISLHC